MSMPQPHDPRQDPRLLRRRARLYLIIGVALWLGLLPAGGFVGLSNVSEVGFMPNGWSGVATALLAVAFAFGGIELVTVAAAESGAGVRPSEVEDEVRAYVASVLSEATLTPAEPSRWTARDGRRGIHSRPMGYLLAEMQHIARSHPGATW